MASNEYVNRVDYGNDTLIDISDTTAEAGDVIQGQTFYTRSGAPATGTLGNATQSAHGLMSAVDKIKLDNLNGFTYQEIEVSIPTTAWPNSAPYTYTWTNSAITSNCCVFAEFKYGSSSLLNNDIGYDKVSGGVQFTALEKPTTAINVIVQIIEGDTNNNPSVIVDPTLTSSGSAADAKVTGDRITAAEASIQSLNTAMTYIANSSVLNTDVISSNQTLVSIEPLNALTTSMTIWTYKKNLLDPSLFQTAISVFDDGHTEASAASICSNLIPISRSLGSNLYLQFASSLASTNGAIRFAFYNASGTFISYSGTWYWSGKTTVQSVEIPSNTKYFRISFHGMWDKSSTASDFLTNNVVMLEYGTAASTYEAYSGTTISFNVASQNVSAVVIPAGGYAILPEACNLTISTTTQASTVNQIIDAAPISSAFAVSKKVNGVNSGIASDVAERFITNRKTGTELVITDALECKVIDCTCTNDITVKGTNLLPSGSITFNWKSPWYQLDDAMTAGDYTLTMSASSDDENITSIQMILSSSMNESTASAAGLLAYRTINLQNGTYATKITADGAHTYVQFYCSTTSAKISIMNPMLVRGYDGTTTQYQKYLKPRTYAPDELYLKDQPIILTANNTSIDLTYIVKTPYIGTLMYGLSGGIMSSGENTTTPEEYGAVGDGVTDDSTAIQAAIDSGAKFVNLNGNYNLGTTGIVLRGKGRRFNFTGNLVYTGTDAAVTAFGCENCRFEFDTIESTGDCLKVTVDHTTNTWYCDYTFSKFSAGSTGACIRITKEEYVAPSTEYGTVSEQRFHGGQCASGGWGIYSDLLYGNNLEEYPGTGWWNQGSFSFYNIGFELVGWGAELHWTRQCAFHDCRSAEQTQTLLYNTNGVLKTVGLCNSILWYGYEGLGSSELSDQTYGLVATGMDMQAPTYSVIYAGKVIPLQKQYGVYATRTGGLGIPYSSNGIVDLDLCCSYDKSGTDAHVSDATDIREKYKRRMPNVVELATGITGLVLPYYYGDIKTSFVEPDIFTQHRGYFNDINIYYKNGVSTDHLTVWKRTKTGGYRSIIDIPANEVDFSTYGVHLHYNGAVGSWTYEKFRVNTMSSQIPIPFYVNDIYDREISVEYDTSPVLKVGASVDGCTYQWQKSTDNGTTWSDITNETSATYTPTLTDEMVGYKYRCTLTYNGTTIISEPTEITDRDIGPSKHAQINAIV